MYWSVATAGYGIFNLRTNVGACCTQEGRSGTNKSAQDLTRRDRKIKCPSPWPTRGVKPRVIRLRFWRSTTELCPLIQAKRGTYISHACQNCKKTKHIHPGHPGPTHLVSEVRGDGKDDQHNERQVRPEPQPVTVTLPENSASGTH